MQTLSQDKKTLFILLAVFMLGCSQNLAQNNPEEYIRQSEAYYKKAESSYKKLILESKDPSEFYLELGKLYYIRGEYGLAIDTFKNSTCAQAKKFLALSFYRMGNFTDAIEIFNREGIEDDEHFYYFGLTCERLNLFDQALKVYKKIQGGEFKPKAILRIEEIEKKRLFINIKNEDLKIAKIISNAPDSSDYPQAGALLLLAKENIEITESNTLESDMHYLIKILNERGKEDFAESLIEYDSTFEKVDLVYARTIKPDGGVVYVGRRHIRDVSKYLNFPLYSNARMMIISFPEVAIGSVLEYKVKIKRSQLVNKKDFFLSYPIQSYEPVISAEFKVTIPKDKNLKFKFLNQEYNDFGANLNPAKEEKSQKRVYSWQFKNIPQVIPEPNMPADVEINPSVILSTFSDWQDVYSWWRDLAQDKIKADIPIKNAVKNLIKGKASDLDKARAIYNFCAKEIRYVAVEYGQAGYEPHSAADIFGNKYGDCKDQSILLVTMLREAGLKAYPVLIATKSYYNMNEDFPSGIFNHCIAALYFKDKKVFLDPTAETCSFGDLPLADQGRRVLVFKEDGYSIEEIPLQIPEHNLIRQKLTVKVNKDESMSAEKINFTLGVYDQRQRYWLLYTQPEMIRDALKSVIQDVSIGAKLNDYNIDNLHDLNTPVTLSYSFQGPEYFTNAGNLRIMPQLASIDISITAKESRKYPIDFGLLDKRESYLEITLPKNFVVKYIPDNIKYDSPWFSFIQEYSYKDNKISFKQVNYGKKEIVTIGEYAKFKSIMEKLARSVKQRVVLEKTE
jgi:transglutaminase-like putative cysteine protease